MISGTSPEPRLFRAADPPQKTRASDTVVYRPGMRIGMRLVHTLCALALAAGPVDAAAKKTTSNAAAAKRSRAAQMRERGLAESLRQSGQARGAVAAYRQYLEKEKRPTEQKWVQRANERIAELQPQADIEEQAAAALAVTAPSQSPTPTAPSTPPPTSPSTPTSPSSPTPTPTAPEAAASPARTIVHGTTEAKPAAPVAVDPAT